MHARSTRFGAAIGGAVLLGLLAGSGVAAASSPAGVHASNWEIYKTFEGRESKQECINAGVAGVRSAWWREYGCDTPTWNRADLWVLWNG